MYEVYLNTKKMLFNKIRTYSCGIGEIYGIQHSSKTFFKCNFSPVTQADILTSFGPTLFLNEKWTEHKTEAYVAVIIP